jgi:hypothetical protein
VLVAAVTRKGGRRMLVLGLEQENVDRLLDDRPILKALDVVDGLGGWDVTILGPEDLVRFLAHFSPSDQAG